MPWLTCFLPLDVYSSKHPYGYKNKTEYPPLCLEGFVCPDEMDACTEQVDVGQPCQLDRDGEHACAHGCFKL